ncbi:hypothetical protein [Halobellus rufus]|uniref:hypothetical protein n=1 Tax=Halobellus rufus TaxID=1448860 RepID=UPI00067926C9|nr:hypothetical protein [Halobellus rufus]
MLSEFFGRKLTLGVVVLVGIGLLSTPVVANVTMDADTTYSGVEADDQTIEATVTIGPDDAQIDDVEIEVDATDRGVLDFRTFSESLEPARADAEVDYLGQGEYTVSQINQGEQFVISFDAYPKTIREENLTVATVTIEYTQRGQRLSDTREVSANLSNSEYFALQQSQREVSNLEGDLRNRQLITYASVGLLVLIPLLAVFRWWEKNRGGIGGSGGDGGSGGSGGGGGGRFD